MKLNVKQILFIVCIIGAAFLAIWRGGRIQTNLNSLVYAENYDGWDITGAISKLSNTINIVVGARNIGTAYSYTNDIANDVKQFPSLHVIDSNVVPSEIIAEFASHRAGLISEKSRQLLERHDFATITKNAITHVSYSMMPTMLPLSQDPFLLFNDYVTGLINGTQNWSMYNGKLWQERNGINYFMINVESENSETLSDEIYQLHQNLSGMNSDDVKIYVGGAPVHTAIMTHQSKIEIGFLSTLAIIMTILITYALFRTFRALIPIFASLTVGFIAGTVAVFLFFSSPHILVFVFGTSLIGIGIDYSFHFIASAASPDKENTRKNIFRSFLTTCLCFTPLLFSSLDLLRQMSVFTITGITAIYIGLRLFPIKSITSIAKNPCFIRPINRKYRTVIVVGLIGIILATLPFMHIKNDITGMYKPNATLGESERIIGDLNGATKSNIVLIRATDIQSLLETEESIRDSGIDIFGISSIIPSITRQRSNSALVQGLYKNSAKQIKSELGLKNIPVFPDTPTLDISTIDNPAIKTIVQRFTFNNENDVYAIATSDQTPIHQNALAINPSDFINGQMSVLGTETYTMLGICAIVMAIMLGLIYRHRMPMYILPPILGGALAIGLVTLFGAPITFFHLISLFIIIGIGIDYTIFHIDFKNTLELKPVLFSFLTSFIGFGLLAFTSFFLIAAMGITLGLGIGFCYLISFLLFRETGNGDKCSPVK